MKKKIDLIKKMLQNKSGRIEQIKVFQELIWNDNHPNSILSELAYDLDFYEPNEELRKEDPSYYGDEKLERMLNVIIINLQGKEVHG
ncbi:MAG: hypothetical protein LBN74_03835 [Prevotella sp.]|jgi:hypothetical protein|nr:hypothetical protein [Prevotella sp.]